MQPDDNDKLWELLGKSRPPVVSPFFSRNVLRAIRQESEDGRGSRQNARAFFSKLTRTLRRRVWQAAIAGACAVAALITMAPTVFVRHHHSATIQSGGIARQIVGNPDYEVIKHLDELVADEESSLWLDDSVNSVN